MPFVTANPAARFIALALAFDVCALAVACGATAVLLQPDIPPVPAAALGIAITAVYLASLQLLGLYDPGILNRPAGFLGRIAAGAGTTALAVGALAYQATVAPEILHTTAFGFGLLYGGLALGRLGLLVALGRRWSHERVLVLGTNGLGQAIAHAVRTRPRRGVALLGFLSDDPSEYRSLIAGYPVIDWTQRVEKVLVDRTVGRVVIADLDGAEGTPAEALVSARVRGLPVETGRSFYERVSGRVYVPGLTDEALMLEPGFRASWVTRAAKRGLDILGSALGLLLVSPLLLAAGIAIRLDSKGRVFYFQERLGAQGRPFYIVKLRTMRHDAEHETGAVWCEEDDPRITRVGRLLRKSRIDELPQLWNVLRGEMSLVGPRPERPEFASELGSSYPQFRLRTEVRPGITGWAQTRYGYVSDVDDYEQKLSLDLYYLKHRSLLFDLWILWDTARTLVWMRGT